MIELGYDEEDGGISVCDMTGLGQPVDHSHDELRYEMPCRLQAAGDKEGGCILKEHVRRGRRRCHDWDHLRHGESAAL
jgi:hypothetical protein